MAKLTVIFNKLVSRMQDLERQILCKPDEAAEVTPPDPQDTIING